MSKLIVTANSISHLNTLLKKDIDGVILYIKDLSVNSSFYITEKELNKIDFLNKEVFICINKIMHNNDLILIDNFLYAIKEKNYKILFYDMAVYNIAKKYNIIDKLVLYQDHLNANSISNNFYYDLGIKGSYINSDITKEELTLLKKNSKGFIMYTTFGYVPIFYSRRYLVTNYLKFIGKNKKDTNYYIKDETDKYPIKEEDYGTTIYTKKPINLINHQKELNNIDYLVLHSNLINDNEFNIMIDKYINKERIDNEYIGFYNTKTIFKVKGE